MFRRAFFALVAFCVVSSTCQAQEWARKMFEQTSHDFGTVARGAKSEYRFKFKNLFEEDVHVVGVRSSCGCTTPTVTKQHLKTYETSEVIAKFNTGTFLGYRSATLTVTIDKPFYAEVQLQITGNIRGDIVVNPSYVSLGTVDRGVGTVKRVSVACTGRSDWKIVDVRSANTSFEVEVVETGRSPSQVSYDLNVRLKETAPVGYIRDQLILVTNDTRAPQFPVDVEGNVISDAITVSPTSLSMGVLAPGQKVTKPVVIVGRKPFKLLEIKCDDPAFTFQIPADGVAKTRHIVPVTFTASDAVGKVTQTIRVRTDRSKDALELTAQAQIAADEAN